VTEPRTHYQLTFTARQAVGGFLGLLLGLGLAFGIGLIAGLRRSPAGAEASNPAAPTPETAAASASTASADVSGDGMPPIETAVPTAAAGAAGGAGTSPGSRTEIFGATQSVTTPAPSDPTPPATLQTFQDGSSDTSTSAAESGGEPESSPIASASGGSGPVASKPAAGPSTAPGKYWVQVASLSSREEAGSLSTRLSRHGFRSQVLTASGPKGKGKVYRVRVGPFRSEDDAEKAATRLSRQEKVKSPWVVPDGM
jgi:cell division septation protein DedD